MVSVIVPVEPADHDRLIAELWEAGTLGVVEAEGAVQAFFEDAETAARFGEPRESGDVDWVRMSEDAWPPLLVGERFFVVAPWRTEPAPPGRFRLEINPGQQCGTGQHPCTRLCLEALERMVRPGDAVLDVGSGSGILARAAWLLGASRVVACDIDPLAALAPALGPQEDGSQEDGPHDPGARIPFFLGSVDAVRTGAFDLVVANINESVTGELRGEFERVAARRILSGFRDERGEWTCVTS